WSRQTPEALTPLNLAAVAVGKTDPPDSKPGMARVCLDPEGRLRSLMIVPGERTVSTSAGEPDWGPLLRATGIDAGTVASVAPEWAPPVFADRRVAWSASWPGRSDTPLRIEAASAGGKPV